MNDWGDDSVTGPFGAGGAETKCTEKEEMNLKRTVNISLCYIRDNETEIESSSDGSIIEERNAHRKKR